MPAEIRHPKPAVSEETRAYWEGCRRHELVLQRCGACGLVRHPPRALCPACLSDETVHFRASGRGTVHTYTVTHQNLAPGFREATPYVLAWVELEEGPRLFTNLIGCDPTSVSIGMPVRVEYADLDDEIAVPRFVPA